MRIERMQKRSSSNAISSATPKSGGINGAGITTDYVVAAAAGVIRVIDAELSVIKNIEAFSPELQLAGFSDLEMFQQGHVEVQAPGIGQEIPPRVPEGESPRSDKLGRIAQELAKAPGVVARRRQSLHHVGYEAAIPSPLETPALSVREMPVLPALLITVNGVPDW